MLSENLKFIHNIEKSKIGCHCNLSAAIQRPEKCVFKSHNVISIFISWGNAYKS